MMSDFEKKIGIVKLLSQEGKQDSQFTPPELCQEILDKIDVTDKTILTFNIEFVLTLIFKYNVDRSNITIYTVNEQVKNICKSSGVKCIDTMEPSMKFDVVVGNPPFNDSQSLKNNTGNYMSSSKRLHLTFIDKALQMSGNVVMIAPVRGWWVGKHKANHAEKYSQQGLYLVEDKGLPFEGVFTGEIGVFYFNKDVEFIRDDFGQKDPLSNSIVDQYVMHSMAGERTPNSLKDELLDGGQYKVILTSMQDGYTNDDNLFEDKSRGNWRVGFNHNGNKGGKGVFGGRIQVVAPTDYLSLSMSCLVVSCEKEAQEVCDYLMSDEIIKLMCDIKVSCTNSKYHMSFIKPYTC